VTVTGPLVAFTQVAVPFVSSGALLIVTSLGSEVVQVASTVVRICGIAHPLPEMTSGPLTAPNLTSFAGAFEA